MWLNWIQMWQSSLHGPIWESHQNTFLSLEKRCLAYETLSTCCTSILKRHRRTNLVSIYKPLLIQLNLLNMCCASVHCAESCYAWPLLPRTAGDTKGGFLSSGWPLEEESSLSRRESWKRWSLLGTAPVKCKYLKLHLHKTESSMNIRH